MTGPSEASEASEARSLAPKERLLAAALGAVFLLCPVSMALKTGSLLLAAAVWICLLYTSPSPRD